MYIPLGKERFDELTGPLSRAGREVLVELLKQMEERADEERPPDIPDRYDTLSRKDKETLLTVFDELDRAHTREVVEAEGMVSLLGQARAVINRAHVLDPTLGDDATLGEAMEILKRHGETSGLSEEAMELDVWVPKED